MVAYFYIGLVILVTLVGDTSCSFGDRLDAYTYCLMRNKPFCNYPNYPGELPLHLKIFGWSCLDELKYQCMHNTTTELLAMGYPVFQFHGKWPFARLLGIQEPASTIFSLGNLLAHVLGWLKFSQCITSSYPFYLTAKFYFLVNVNCWFWSTVFHTRDLDFTEKMDYFCATLMVLSSILVSFVRIVGDQKDQKCFVFGSALVVLYAYHTYTMGFIKFDYGWNMKFNVFIGTMNVIMWLSWCFWKRHERPYVWKCAFIVVSVFLCVGLELFDFPPIWWTFDAHSLWHLATIPFCYFWYSFLIDDASYENSLLKRL